MRSFWSSTGKCSSSGSAARALATVHANAKRKALRAFLVRFHASCASTPSLGDTAVDSGTESVCEGCADLGLVLPAEENQQPRTCSCRSGGGGSSTLIDFLAEAA